MTISYPVTLPASPKFSKFSWRAIDIVSADENDFTADVVVYDWLVGYRIADISLPPMTRAQSAPWAAAFKSLKGRRGTFYAGPPPGFGATPRGIGTGTPVIAGANQTGETIATSGWTAGQTGILKADDYCSVAFNLFNQLVDVNSDGGGLASLTWWPRARIAPANGATITVTNPLGIFKLLDNVAEDMEPVLMAGFQFSAREIRSL